ncbi:MAG TPA: amidohydrolase family protein [Patescibacteria group bacterium]
MSLSTFPGLIDIHVHLREPGATHKEDFATGTRAAVRGGFTFIIDMPNNPQPTISLERLREKKQLAKEKAVCGLGFHYGTNGLNTDSFKKAAADTSVFGLKLYCNHTTGEMLLEDLTLLEKVFAAWASDKPILVHAEGVELAAAIALARLYDRRLHVCHISQATEVELVRRAKAKKQQITAGVCPHHLWLTEKDREKMGAWAIMKPPLGTEQDREELWVGIADRTIDIVETDHAPHTKKEKAGEVPPYGVPGLETAFSLTLKGLQDRHLPLRLLKELLHTRPKKIFAIPEQKNTFIEVDLEDTWMVDDTHLATKCGWSPFTGWELPGVVKRVVIKGKTVYVG